MKRLLAIVVAVAFVAGLAPSLVAAHGPRGRASGFRSGHATRSPARIGRRGFVGRGSVIWGPAPVTRDSVIWGPAPITRDSVIWGPAPRAFVRDRRGVVPRAHQFHRRQFAPLVDVPSVLVTSTPAEAADLVPVVYEPGPVYAPNPVATISSAAVLPTPTVVDFPTGWYQLRGDGVTTPYIWVWIPKPPVTPAAVVEASPPAAEPATSVEAGPREALKPAYHWTDGTGVTTWTNRLDRVPKRFRDQAATSAEPD